MPEPTAQSERPCCGDDSRARRRVPLRCLRVVEQKPPIGTFRQLHPLGGPRVGGVLVHGDATPVDRALLVQPPGGGTAVPRHPVWR